MTPETFYTSQTEIYRKISDQLKKRRNYITLSKLAAFLLMIYAIYRIINGDSIASFYLAGGLLLFIIFTRIDGKIVRKQKFTDNLININESENAYLKGDISVFDGGEEYFNPSHPYSNDLDIFGEDSLFRHLNRTVTHTGKALLADWLLSPCKNREEIIRRQEAAQELSQSPEWCIHFRAAGKSSPSTHADLNALQLWKQENYFFKNSNKTKVALYTVNIITLILYVFAILGILPVSLALTASGIELLVWALFLKKINNYHSRLNLFIRTIANYHPLIQKIETHPFTSIYFKEIQQLLFCEKTNASRALIELRRIQEALDQRSNPLAVFVLNGVYLRDLHTLLQLDLWKKKHARNIDCWIKAISLTDCLVSMGTFRFNHPEYIFPEPNNHIILDTQGVGHPLIQGKHCVTNDFNLRKDRELYIVTGANMAGKSTFLRTIGVNLVLALSGNAVRSQSFKFKPMALFTSMRTTDNLAKNTSYFHAELLRLKQLTETAKREETVFVILDEMLKGTNSLDKLKGSKAFLHKLLDYPVCGLIATHDLELGKLADEYPEHFFNVCFEITHQGEEILYDYKLRPGVSNTMNASILLKKMELI